MRVCDGVNLKGLKWCAKGGAHLVMIARPEATKEGGLGMGAPCGLRGYNSMPAPFPGRMS